MITLTAKAFSVRLTTPAGVVFFSPDPSPTFRLLLAPAIRGEPGPTGKFGDTWQGPWSDRNHVYEADDLLYFAGEGTYLVITGFTSTLGSVPTDYNVALVAADGAKGTEFVVSTTPPDDPFEGMLWLDIS